MCLPNRITDTTNVQAKAGSTKTSSKKARAFKSKMCIFFPLGNCAKGERCAFAHRPEETKLHTPAKPCAAPAFLAMPGESWASTPPEIPYRQYLRQVGLQEMLGTCGGMAAASESQSWSHQLDAGISMKRDLEPMTIQPRLVEPATFDSNGVWGQATGVVARWSL
jgi:hypothetical protein